jgi:hypothetical protein
VNTLNEAYAPLSARRRYEAWFIRLGLADGNGAWWFRYLLMNPARGGCGRDSGQRPVQVWATWFPPRSTPQSFIQGFPLSELELSARGESPLHFRLANNAIKENSCRGALELGGHTVSWDLQYRSTFGVTLSDKGWIGFSRTPHSDAVFSGHITLDEHTFAGEPLGFGVQGHNSGYRHRNSWTWAHAYFLRPEGPPSTLEALLYDMPFGLFFRKVVLWHEGQPHAFGNLREIKRDREKLQWNFCCSQPAGLEGEVAFDGSGASMHCLRYVKTDCRGTLEVRNNSLASAALCLRRPNGCVERLETATGAVVEMGGC